MDRRLFSLGIILALTGCGPEGHSLKPDTLRQYKITGIVVRNGDKIPSWPAQESAYVKQAKPSEEEEQRLASAPAGSFPALRKQMEEALSAKIAAQVNNQLGSTFSGPIPAELVVTVKIFDIPSTIRRFLADQTAKIQLNIDLVDKRSGKTILSFAGPFKGMYLLGGLSSIAEKAIQGDDNDHANALISGYITDYAAWLKGSGNS